METAYRWSPEVEKRVIALLRVGCAAVWGWLLFCALGAGLGAWMAWG